jgi:hypothetical protein
MLLRQGRPSGFEEEWNPPDPSRCHPQARSIYLALANFNAIAYTVYAGVPLSTMNQLKGLPQYQMFVELLNYFYCGIKHFFGSSSEGGMTQSLRQRLEIEHDKLGFHIRRMTHTRRFPFRETGGALRGRLRDIPNEDLFELYLLIELRKLPQQQRPHTISKFFLFCPQIGHTVCFIYLSKSTHRGYKLSQGSAIAKARKPSGPRSLQK